LRFYLINFQGLYLSEHHNFSDARHAMALRPEDVPDWMTRLYALGMPVFAVRVESLQVSTALLAEQAERDAAEMDAAGIA
jgi:hypothetical protein